MLINESSDLHLHARRSTLIAADKIIEILFTPASESMQLSARVYKDWKFTDQAFPTDVLNRRAISHLMPSAPINFITPSCLLLSTHNQNHTYAV